MLVLDDVLQNYFIAHRELIATEQVDDNNIVVSFPLHFVGNHRIEVSVSQVLGDSLLMSDAGRTISELRDYGYSVSPGLISRMTEIVKPAKVRIINDNLVMDCRPEEVGSALHSFAEAAKTIGDAYLAFHVKTPPERKLLEAVGQLLNELEIPYRAGHKIHGKIDAHSVDFYMPPNGHPGLALEVLGGYNTHTTAQIWHFKCQDIRSFDKRMRVGLVYDTEDSNWSQKSAAILHDVADFALPSNELVSLPNIVKSTVA
jgi:hypothetical protein